MKFNGRRLLTVTLVWAVGLTALAQTYVTPKLGGGQVATAQMIHVEISYDADADLLNAVVDDSYGIPELVALEPGYAFDPAAAYAVLNGKAYNAQYGWNPGLFTGFPAGAAIWVEQTAASPELEVYDGTGTPQSAPYTPIFGTAGSSPRWKWTGRMVHNVYAVRQPRSGSYYARYHVYFGDANSGSRENFMQYDDATVLLEWTTVPVAGPVPFEFGAVDLATGTPLQFLNAPRFSTNSGHVENLRLTNTGPWAQQYATEVSLEAVASTAANGGPVVGHAAAGSCLSMQFISLTGPDGRLQFWKNGETQPLLSIYSGEDSGTNRVRVSARDTSAGADPFGQVAGRFVVDQPGLYCVGFKLVDTSTNGLAGGTVHTSSDTYYVYLQAGWTLGLPALGQGSLEVPFGGEPGRTFYLERSTNGVTAASWEGVAGPLAGTNQLQSFTVTPPNASGVFYRLRVE